MRDFLVGEVDGVHGDQVGADQPVGDRILRRDHAHEGHPREIIPLGDHLAEQQAGSGKPGRDGVQERFCR